MDLKKPKTFTQQIEILKNRNLFVEDPAHAEKILSFVNYYNFTGYLYTYKDRNDLYHDITFDTAYSIYLCDKRIKSIILYAVELIEHRLKTTIAYILAHTLGELCYMDVSNFKNVEEHNKLINKFNQAVKQNKNVPFVKHHLVKYNGLFPIWVAIELFTLGMIWNLYKYLQTPLQKKIASQFKVGVVHLESWIECISYLRNQAAHDMRLYRVKLQKTPKKSKYHNNIMATNRVFDIIYAMKFIAPDTDEWNNYIISTFSQIFDEYKESVALSDYGFPEDWDILLKK